MVEEADELDDEAVDTNSQKSKRSHLTHLLLPKGEKKNKE